MGRYSFFRIVCLFSVLSIVILFAGCSGASSKDVSGPAYSILVTVSGLNGTLVLQNNGGDDLRITTNGTFAFATKVATLNIYNVTVKSQPAGQTCALDNAVGTVQGGSATVSAVCTTNDAESTQLGLARADTEVNGVTVDSSGNEYVVGYTNGGLDGNILTGTTDFFVTMYDASGNKVRTRQLGAAGAETVANGVAVDSSGNVYVAGYTNGNLDGNTLAGTTDFFVTMYDASGNKVRTRQLGAAGAETWASGVTVDSSGNVYVTGYTDGDLDGNTLTGTMHSFVTKYDSSGDMQ